MIKNFKYFIIKMNLTKDAYLYILNFADDRTILNMLSTNKKFHNIGDEKFFEMIMKRKYPLLIRFKNDDHYLKKFETWKHLYIRMVYYISKLDEEFKIPYIATEDFNPENFYLNHIINDPSNFYNYAMLEAAKGGLLDVVILMIKKGANDYGTTMIFAASRGHLNIVKYMISREVRKRYIRESIEEAKEAGHTNIVEFLENFLNNL
jgi:hypothetical protein